MNWSERYIKKLKKPIEWEPRTTRGWIDIIIGTSKTGKEKFEDYQKQKNEK
jgi:hypothetical protein